MSTENDKTPIDIEATFESYPSGTIITKVVGFFPGISVIVSPGPHEDAMKIEVAGFGGLHLETDQGKAEGAELLEHVASMLRGERGEIIDVEQEQPDIAVHPATDARSTTEDVTG